MTKLVLTEIKIAAMEAPKMYFAPLVGAVRGIGQQYRLLNAKRAPGKAEPKAKTLSAGAAK